MEFEKLSVVQQNYLTYLNNISEDDQLTLFTNSGIEHAEILMYKIFEKTTSDICIYARGLLPDLTNLPLYREGLEMLVSKERRVNVLLETDRFRNDTNSALFYLLSQKNNKKITCRVLKEGAFENLQRLFVGYEHCNFCVADSKMFRYEVNPEKYEAIGSFNNTELSVRFRGIFDKFFTDEHSSQLN